MNLIKYINSTPLNKPWKHLCNNKKSVLLFGKYLSTGTRGKSIPVDYELKNNLSESKSRTSILEEPMRPALIKNFANHCKTDLERYNHLLPPHFFPLWCTYPIGATLLKLPFNFLSTLNGEINLQINSPIPSNSKLITTTKIKDIIQKNNLIIITTETKTGPLIRPDSLIIQQKTILKTQPGKKKKERSVNDLALNDCIKIGDISPHQNSGLEFAFLTGDPNPIHYSSHIAKLFGFKNSILQGYSIFSILFSILEIENKNNFSEEIHSINVRFSKPVYLNENYYLSINDSNYFYLHNENRICVEGHLT